MSSLGALNLLESWDAGGASQIIVAIILRLCSSVSVI